MSKPFASDGFTLLEMLVMMAIISLAAGVAYAGMNLRGPRASLRTVSQEIANKAAAASLRAISKGRTASLEVNVPNRIITSGDAGPDIHVPESFRIIVLTGATLIQQRETGSIEFYSDGTSSGGEIELEAADGRSSKVRIFWLTGAITIERGGRT